MQKKGGGVFLRRRGPGVLRQRTIGAGVVLG